VAEAVRQWSTSSLAHGRRQDHVDFLGTYYACKPFYTDLFSGRMETWPSAGSVLALASLFYTDLFSGRTDIIFGGSFCFC
jgi:hypothetical protein